MLAFWRSAAMDKNFIPLAELRVVDVAHARWFVKVPHQIPCVDEENLEVGPGIFIFLVHTLCGAHTAPGR